MVIRLGTDIIMTKVGSGMFQTKSKMFVTSVRRSEVGMRLKPGVKQMIMKGNTVVASGRQQHARGKTRVDMV